ncbi:unnamed protein product [Oikopleura dioica]|uniref:Uncharacterized protein n=1 Tax=Oikopleura dioica TaxID=34765 RepID=E4Z6I2_OIKDI|nr:unnamed protein product [Oikopleura dioica]
MMKNRNKKAVQLALSILCLMSVTVVFTNPVYLQKKDFSESPAKPQTTAEPHSEIIFSTRKPTTTSETEAATSMIVTTSAENFSSTRVITTDRTEASSTRPAITTEISDDSMSTEATVSASTTITEAATEITTRAKTSTSAISDARTSTEAPQTTPAATTTSDFRTKSATFEYTTRVGTPNLTTTTAASSTATTRSSTSYEETTQTKEFSTTLAETTNPCFDHNCGDLTCFPINNIATCFDPQISKIGFLTYDRNMTVKCANANSGGKLFTKHECLDRSDYCELDLVKIHMTFFEATLNKNEYYINTHAAEPSRAMYQLDENHSKASWVLQLEREIWESNEELGSTWLIEKVECNEERCPVFVRAAERPHRGWKRDHSERDSPLLALDTIDKNNEDFWWFIEIQ